MAEVNFFLKDKNKPESLVQAIIRNKGERYKISTGIIVATEFWKQDKHRCNASNKGKKYPEAYLFNERLDAWENVLNQALHDFSRDLITPTANLFKEKVEELIAAKNELAGVSHPSEQNEDFTNFIVEFCNQAVRAPNTIKSYITTLNLLTEYQKVSKQTLTFKDIDIEFYWQLKKWLMEKDKSVNYIGTVFKNIKTFMNQARDRGIHNFSGHTHKEFKAVDEDVDTIFLTQDEILKIFHLKFDDELLINAFPKIVNVKGNLERKIQSYEDHRDAFIIGYCTALRHSDYSRLIDLNVSNDIVSIWTRKMDKKVFIPKHWMLQEILKRRNNKLPTAISDQKHNKRIKEIGMLAGITQEVLITRTAGDKRLDETYKKYELITTHTARRSGATNMYLAGIDIKFIQEILGHSKIETTLKYIRVNQEENAKRLVGHGFFRN